MRADDESVVLSVARDFYAKVLSAGIPEADEIMCDPSGWVSFEWTTDDPYLLAVVDRTSADVYTDSADPYPGFIGPIGAAVEFVRDVRRPTNGRIESVGRDLDVLAALFFFRVW